MNNEKSINGCFGNSQNLTDGGQDSPFLPSLQTHMAILLFLILAGGGINGQNLQQKDLAFAQVAAGPEIETVIAMTNPAGSHYEGTVHFWSGSDEPWNPVVNGARVADSKLDLRIEPGETMVLRITDDSLTTGAVLLKATKAALDNFIEGNLTYLIDGDHFDSVGIAPCTELYRSAIPFEEFSAVALALANSSIDEVSVVGLRLIDSSGQEQESVTQVLSERSHQARFLFEIFSSRIEKGKVEIEATRPIIGTAVTLKKGEISSLPMLPSPVTYDLRTDIGPELDRAEMVLWVEGTFVKGYLRFFEIDAEPVPNSETYLVTGTLENGELRLTQYGLEDSVGEDVVSYLKVENFTFDRKTWKGTYSRIIDGFPFQHILDRNFELTRR
jgi:hypothetical protein